MSVGSLATVRMAHDIARQFPHLTREEAALTVSTHIKKFWEPRMLTQFVRQVRDSQDELDPVVVAAAALLSEDEYDRAEVAEPSGG